LLRLLESAALRAADYALDSGLRRNDDVGV
jgi:hypothetical protein